MKILAIDPGGTTGWATYDSNPYKNRPTWDHGELGPKEHHLDLWYLMDEARPEWLEPDRREPLYIIGESFQYRNGLDKAELISCEYIGIIKMFPYEHYAIILVWQTAAQGKVTPTSFVKRRHLERLGLWDPKQPNHAMDGYGHLIYYVINGGNPELKDLRLMLLQKGWRS
jgi:hypothetical protein